jgi:LPS O-antigen subunit length determinant protein (WzzB/FepE family)
MDDFFMAAIDINSSCSRVDFVKSLASQLKLQVTQASHSIPADDAQRKLQSKLDAVDQAVKGGDPQKAEQALSELQNAVSSSQNGVSHSSAGSKSVDVYA